jgi:integrase
MPHLSFSAKLPPTKPQNQARRTREYLTPAEVERLLSAARKVGRYGDRDATLMLLMYRHGLRVAEVSRLRWEHVDMQAALLHVRRLKHGVSSVHPLHGPELRALRGYGKEVCNFPGSRQDRAGTRRYHNVFTP